MGEPLVAGHGNFGSLDADPPAAMRYTECKLQPLSDAMLLADLSESTVAYTSTFDGSQNEPAVLPARLPNLLLNGSTGIAVGMATSIPPHNLSELVDALTLVARKPGATLQEVLAVMPAPDFPTGGTILAGEPMLKGYHTGNGGFTLRCVVCTPGGTVRSRSPCACHACFAAAPPPSRPCLTSRRVRRSSSARSRTAATRPPW